MNTGDHIPWLHNVAPEDVRRIVEALYRVHGLIAVITDLGTLLERIMEEGKEVAQAEACSLMLYDPEAQELYFQVAQGETGDQAALKNQVRLKLDQGIAGAAAATRKSINVSNVAEDARFYAGADAISRFKTHSLLAVPLLDRDTLVGVLEVINKTGGGAFTEIDLHVMEMFSSLAATSIMNSRLIEENLRKERMAAIGQAVAGLSHYIKNIITGMSGSTELIDAGLRTKNTELLETSWPIYKRSTRKISIFVQDMLAFSKPRQPMREACRIRAILEDAAQTLLGLLPQKKVALTIDTDEAIQAVYVDPQGMFSCILNLFTNAADAVAEGTGAIHAKASIVPEGGLVLTISDNGPGIPEDQRRSVFEPFYSTKGTKGTGLGLAVTQKIVREHGGEISVERAPEGGALFRIVLPHAARAEG